MLMKSGRKKGSPQKNSWPDDHIAKLREWWTVDGLSASQCASAFGELNAHYTRSAIIGKVHRLGIGADAPRRARNPGPPKGTPRITKRRSPFRSEHAAAISKSHATNIAKAEAQVAMEEALKVPVPSNAITNRDREPHQCAWPVGENDKGEMMVCGGKVLMNKRDAVYCVHHQRAGTVREHRKPIRAWS